MAIDISTLNTRELKVHDDLIKFFIAFGKLTHKEQVNVFQRWLMLKIMTEEELKFFLTWNQRILKEG